jgi:hypothetical protein
MTVYEHEMRERAPQPSLQLLSLELSFHRSPSRTAIQHEPSPAAAVSVLSTTVYFWTSLLRLAPAHSVFPSQEDSCEILSQMYTISHKRRVRAQRDVCVRNTEYGIQECQQHYSVEFCAHTCEPSSLGTCHMKCTCGYTCEHTPACMHLSMHLSIFLWMQSAPMSLHTQLDAHLCVPKYDYRYACQASRRANTQSKISIKHEILLL